VRLVYVALKLFCFEVNFELKLVELFLVESCGSVKHNVATAVILGESDTVADAVKAGEQRYPTVETIGETTVRRSTELECVHEEAELLLSFLRSKS
jgi:hypothetical protein